MLETAIESYAILKKQFRLSEQGLIPQNPEQIQKERIKALLNLRYLSHDSQSFSEATKYTLEATEICQYLMVHNLSVDGETLRNILLCYVWQEFYIHQIWLSQKTEESSKNFVNSIELLNQALKLYTPGISNPNLLKEVYHSYRQQASHYLEIAAYYFDRISKEDQHSIAIYLEKLKKAKKNLLAYIISYKNSAQEINILKVSYKDYLMIIHLYFEQVFSSRLIYFTFHKLDLFENFEESFALFKEMSALFNSTDGKREFIQDNYPLLDDYLKFTSFIKLNLNNFLSATETEMIRMIKHYNTILSYLEKIYMILPNQELQKSLKDTYYTLLEIAFSSDVSTSSQIYQLLKTRDFPYSTEFLIYACHSMAEAKNENDRVIITNLLEHGIELDLNKIFHLFHKYNIPIPLPISHVDTIAFGFLKNIFKHCSPLPSVINFNGIFPSLKQKMGAAAIQAILHGLELNPNFMNVISFCLIKDSILTAKAQTILRNFAKLHNKTLTDKPMDSNAPSSMIVPKINISEIYRKAKNSYLKIQSLTENSIKYIPKNNPARNTEFSHRTRQFRFYSKQLDLELNDLKDRLQPLLEFIQAEETQFSDEDRTMFMEIKSFLDEVEENKGPTYENIKSAIELLAVIPKKEIPDAYYQIGMRLAFMPQKKGTKSFIHKKGYCYLLHFLYALSTENDPNLLNLKNETLSALDVLALPVLRTTSTRITKTIFETGSLPTLDEDCIQFSQWIEKTWNKIPRLISGDYSTEFQDLNNSSWHHQIIKKLVISSSNSLTKPNSFLTNNNSLTHFAKGIEEEGKESSVFSKGVIIQDEVNLNNLPDDCSDDSADDDAKCQNAEKINSISI